MAKLFFAMEALVVVLFDLYKQTTIIIMCINGTRKNHSRSQCHDFTALLKLCIAVYVLGNPAPWAGGCAREPSTLGRGGCARE